MSKVFTMSKVFEIKPGYAVEISDGFTMVAMVCSSMEDTTITGTADNDVIIASNAKPMTFLYGECEDGSPNFWPISNYNDNLEYVGLDGTDRDPDLDIVKVYGYTTPMFSLNVSDEAMKIRPVLWQRDAASKTDTGKAPTYEDAKKAVQEMMSEIDKSDIPDSDKKAAKAYVGFLDILDMMTDLVHMIHMIDDAKDDN